MTTIATARPTIQWPEPEYLVDDAQLAGAAGLDQGAYHLRSADT